LISHEFVIHNELGVSLVELLVAMFIGMLLLTGLVQVAASARGSFLLQEGLAEVQENGRFAIDSLAAILRQSAFTPQPWVDSAVRVGVTDESEESIRARGDRVAVRTWSERNCFDNLNPISDDDGQPRFFLKESVLELNGSKNLAHTCRFGPSEDQLVTQIRRQGMVQNVDAFQVLYAEDLDGDRQVDRWVSGGNWSDEQAVMGLQLAVLLGSSAAVSEPLSKTYMVLDQAVSPPRDGKLRRVFTYTHFFRGSGG